VISHSGGVERTAPAVTSRPPANAKLIARLIIAARELGDEATAGTREQILPEEYAMARAVEENLPIVMRNTLHSQAAARQPLPVPAPESSGGAHLGLSAVGP
jgi:hypothetical protein